MSYTRTSVKTNRPHVWRKLLSCLMALMVTTVAGPCPWALAAQPILQPPSAALVPKPPAAALFPKPAVKPVHVKTGPHKIKKIVPRLSFSEHPSDLEISTARALPEPLVPMTSAPVNGENEALAKTLVSFKKRTSPEDLSDLIQFTVDFPHSRWRPAVELNLGNLRYEMGYLCEALENWQSAFDGAKSETGHSQMAIANRGIALLLRADARLGRVEELKRLLSVVGKRSFFGSDESIVQSARNGLWMMLNRPDCAFKCGPFAVDNLLVSQNPPRPRSKVAEAAVSTKDGTNLSQVMDLATEVGLHYQMAKRSLGAPVPTPSVMHWKVGHFADVASRVNGVYIVKDPTFDCNGTLAMSSTALDKETDGYFLVPAGPLPQGWQPVTREEAKTVWGKGDTIAQGDNDMRTGAPVRCDGDCCSVGMARARFWEMNAAVNIQDNPVHYTNPLNDMPFRVNYNQYETNQPATFTFTNMGSDWKFPFFSYLTIAGGSNVATIRLPGGGSEVATPSSGIYPPDYLSQAVLVAEGGGVYQRQLPDGSVQVFNQADGSGDIFMTEMIDPQGNSTLIQYDADFRITTITDAINQVTTVSYLSNTLGNPGFYKVASITDPFGRSCTFSYDSTDTMLVSITDVIGLTSQFNYDTSSLFVTSMSTPYGTTSFYPYIPPASAGFNYPARGLRTTFPDGTTSVIENWVNALNTTYYWDREQAMLYPTDPVQQNYTHCEQTVWLMNLEDYREAPGPATVTHPLESAGPTNFYYAGQVAAPYLGTSLNPTIITRTLSGNPSITSNSPGIINATIGGTVTSGNTVTIQVVVYGGPNESITYTVQSGDTLSTIASSLASLINSNSALAPYNAVATSVGPVISMYLDWDNAVTFYESTSGGATETVTLASQTQQAGYITYTGTVTTGNTIYCTITDSNLSGTQYLTYTVMPGDTLTSIAAAIASTINSDSTLTAAGYVATSDGPLVISTCNSPRLVTYVAGSYNQTENATVAVLSGQFQTSQYQYNTLGHVTQSVDQNQRTFSYAYAGNNIDLEQITETQGGDDYQIGAWTYNSQHRPLTYTDGSGQVTDYAYNSSGQLISITDADSNVTTLTYTGTDTATIGGSKSTGDVLTITAHDAGLGGGEEAVSYTVLSGDTLSSIAAGLTSAINADVNLQGIGVSATSASTVITLSSTSVNVTTYTESASGGATETITLGTNTFGFLTKIDGPLSGSDDVTTFAYDAYNRLSQVTDSEGYTVQYAYDDMNRLTQTTYPDGTTEQTIYDRLDPVLTKDRIGRWTQDSFDSLRQLTYEIDPLGRKTQYTWCACGGLSTMTDANGHVTTWIRDIEGRVTSKVYQDQTSVDYDYELHTSRLRTRTDALGQVTNYMYNVDNTPYQITYLNAVNPTATVTYTWDPNFNRISSIQKNDWGTYSYTYNAYIMPSGSPTTGGGRLASVSNNVIANSEITYSYDALGRTTNRSINGGSNSIDWTYDAMSRITAEANALGTFDYAYVDDVPGSSKGTLRLASISYPNSQMTNFSWYPNIGDQRLKEISNLNPSGATLSQFDYGYDAAGEITQWQQQQNGNNLYYNLGYDLAGQLVSSKAASGGQQSPSASELYYGYDPGANRTSVQTASLSTARIGGSKTTADTLTITVHDPALSGGQEAVTYSVLSGDTLATIAQGLATAINTDTNLQALGVIANAHGSNTFINIRSASNNQTTYTESVSGGATETISFGIFKNGLENATISGSKTTGDTLTLRVLDPALGGGEEAVTYTVLSGDTIATIAAGLKSAVNADSNLSALGVTATVAADVVTVSSASTNATTYTESTSAGATETLTLAANNNVNALAMVAGTVTASDGLTINVYDAGLAGGTEAVTYSVAPGNTLAQIATGLTSAINADTNLQAIGVSASSSGAVVTIQSNSTNSTTYVPSYSSGATESLSFTTPTYGWQVAAIAGSKTTGDVLSLTTFNSSLTNGSEAVSYTVLSGDTLTSIATALASAVNADTSLQDIGVSATSSGTVVSIESLSPNVTTYSQSTSSSATETITLGVTTGIMQAAFNDVNELVSLTPGGAAQFQGTTDKPAASASLNTQVVNIAATANSGSNSTFSAAATSTGTESLAFSTVPYGGYNNSVYYAVTISGSATQGDVVSLTLYDNRITGGSSTVSYTVKSGDSIFSIVYALYEAIGNDAAVNSYINAEALYTNAFYLFDASTVANGPNPFAFTGSVVGAATETTSLAYTSDQNYNLTIAGTKTTDDLITVTVSNPNLSGGQETITYTVLSGDTLTSIATNIASAINASTALQAISVGATSTGAVVSILTDSYYTTSTSGGATETLTLGTNNRGNTSVTVGGTPTTADTLTIATHNQALSGGSEAVTYTVLSTDTLQTIANGLAAALNADTSLQTLGVSSPANAATLATTQTFSGNALLPSGASTAAASAVDGSSNTKSNAYQLRVNNGSTTSLTFDENGNMTSDGNGNTYSWDAENRLIQITYPGVGNNSQFTYDGLGRNVSIVETVSGSVTSTKLFVWDGSVRCAQWNAGSTVTAQFFPLGETISGTSYFYDPDALGLTAGYVQPFMQLSMIGRHPRVFNPLALGGSTREITNSTGVIQGQLAYDPFGRATQLQGTLAPDFQFGGYYLHARSGLNLTVYREYGASLGRWISRDPYVRLGQPYVYSNNIPTQLTDFLGLEPGLYWPPNIPRNPSWPSDLPFPEWHDPLNDWINACERARQIDWGPHGSYCPIPHGCPGNTGPLPDPSDIYPIPSPWQNGAPEYPGSPPWQPTLTKPSNGMA